MPPPPQPPLDHPPESWPVLFRLVLALALPVIFEQLFHTVVGLTDTWLANRLGQDAAAATAAVGTISYIMWFMGLLVSAIGTGSTALTSRAKGAGDHALADSVCGQSVTAALLLGAVLALAFFLAARPIISITGLSPAAKIFALSYLRMLCIAIPFLTVMFVANACLRGAGDTLTPALTMIVVDVVNMGFSYGLTWGLWGLPRLGFDGIAAGTVIAYIVGGALQLFVLSVGWSKVRLHLHALRPHAATMRRVLRIGVPSGLEGLISWIAQFSVVIVINQMDPSNIAAAAHLNTIKIESISYLPGFAFAIAASTLTGQSLGMNSPARARRATYAAWVIAAAIMVACGLLFIFAGRTLADWMLPGQPHIAHLTARCLFVTGFIQAGFAAAMVFSGALRGAGDTYVTMVINLASTLLVRLAGVLVVVLIFKHGVVAVWIVLSTELFLRGILNFLRFLQGKWRHVQV